MSNDEATDLRRSVAAKVVAVLDAFRPATHEASAPTQMSLNELARRSGLPVSTAYRHANELVSLGLLESGEHGGYRIGLRLWEVGSLARRGLSLREVATPYMLDLYEATHENVHLAVLEGHEALYVSKTTGRLSVPVVTKEARRQPLHATGVGKVLLAHAPEPFVREVIADGLPAFTPHTIIAPAPLLRTLDAVRSNGFASCTEEMTLGTVSVAAPITDAHGKVIAAVSLVGRSTHAAIDRLAPAVRTAAFGISRSIHQGTSYDARRHPNV
jgi:DNA-binding IclR family transcriptional regulator